MSTGGGQHNPRASAPLDAREGRGLTVRGPLPEAHNIIPDPSAVLAKGRNPLRDNFSDEFRTVFIGVARHGLGTVVQPFLFKSFHGG